MRTSFSDGAKCQAQERKTSTMELFSLCLQKLCCLKDLDLLVVHLSGPTSLPPPLREWNSPTSQSWQQTQATNREDESQRATYRIVSTPPALLSTTPGKRYCRVMPRPQKTASTPQRKYASDSSRNNAQRINCKSQVTLRAPTLETQ